MTKTLKIIAVIVTALLLQVTVLPAYFVDPFQPNLLIIFVAALGLREDLPAGWLIAFLTGLVQDCFSGIYLGLNGFAYLSVYLLLKMVSDVLYTDSRYLLILVVFLATIATGVLQLVLLFLFSAAHGVYATLLPALLPHALVNALVTAIVTAVSLAAPVEEVP